MMLVVRVVARVGARVVARVVVRVMKLGFLYVEERMWGGRSGNSHRNQIELGCGMWVRLEYARLRYYYQSTPLQWLVDKLYETVSRRR